MDIDEIKRWPLEKQIKWLIALELVTPHVKPETPNISDIFLPKKSGRTFVKQGDKIVML